MVNFKNITMFWYYFLYTILRVKVKGCSSSYSFSCLWIFNFWLKHTHKLIQYVFPQPLVSRREADGVAWRFPGWKLCPSHGQSGRNPCTDCMLTDWQKQLQWGSIPSALSVADSAGNTAVFQEKELSFSLTR